ncbi:fibropellin-1-like isoform X2 [Mercenaria mercenaria]|uniref:fibropellin-1-like isoform X2 n=1 Tax=Mercenaria mercenaria TaxID=6596 RepID=UPI00234F124E|nr:fibropellin-1-like isoform X2 [Mercenaria mercenaria]
MFYLQTTCTISFTASQTIGYYAVALQVEDYANETANTHLSSIPVQFLVNIYSGSGCSVEVEFVSPTPEENEQFIIDAGDTLNVTIFARGTNSFSKIVTILAIGMTQTKEETSKDSTWFYIKTTVTYSPVVSEAGQEHILCFYALDTTGVTNKERCITIYVAGSDNDNCDPDPCFNGATCIDGISNFTCNCQNGYSGETCNSDIDECYDDTNNCDVNAECTNTIGSYTCTCNEGYSVNGTTCSDINECTDGSNNCDANAECTNTDGSFTCSCNDGYSGNGTACSDIDECDDDSHNCNVSAECTNTVGSFTCTCKEGYSGDGTTCLDINECNDGNNNCDANAECTNTIGSFTCSCNAGYSGNGTACSDTDECNDGNYNCDVNAECMNTVGSFMCTCKEGYSGNGTTCSEIIECASSPCQNDANCTDSINGYDCICVHGYSGANCEFDIDDCKPNPCHNDGNCTDGINFYNCTCLSGFYGINCQNVTVVSTLDGKPGATDSSISTIGLIIGVVLAIIILTAGVVVIMKWKGLSLFNRNGHSLQQRPTEESTQAHQNPFYYGNYTYFSEAANMEEPATIRTSKASCDSKEKPSE